MLLSLIIPVYNVEKYIERCINSCIEQNILSNNYEIIIVNDGTQDRSMYIVDIYHKKYPHLIKVLSQENKGLSAARNAGLKIATGDYVWFIDSDDWISSNCLGKIYSKLVCEQPDILALCAANIINDKVIRRNTYKDETVKTGKEVFNKMISPCVPFAIYRREFLLKHNLFFYEGIYHEDAEFMPRTYYNANKVSHLNDIVYNVFPNPTSITRTINPKRAFDIIIVCSSLSRFASEVSEECISHLSFLISMNLNNALALTSQMKSDDVKKLNNLLCKHDEIFKYLKQSKVVKYKIEFYLFKIFPHNIVQIYKLLQCFNYKKLITVH